MHARQELLFAQPKSVCNYFLALRDTRKYTSILCTGVHVTLEATFFSPCNLKLPGAQRENPSSPLLPFVPVKVFCVKCSAAAAAAAAGEAPS